MRIEELLAHSDFVQALARSLVSDEHSAADITQDTWLAVLKHSSEDVKSKRSWLIRVIRNIASNFHRTERRRQEREKASFSPLNIPAPDEVVARGEARRRIIEAVLKLNEPYRTTVLLRFYENLSLKDIARHEDIPIGTIKSRLKRGLDQLRERLDALHGGDRKNWLMAIAPFAGMKLEGAASATSGTVAYLTGAAIMSYKFIFAIVATVILGVAFIVYLLLDTSHQPPLEETSIHPFVTEPTDKVQTHINRRKETDSSISQNTVIIEPAVVYAQIYGRVLARADEKAIADAQVTVTLVHPEKESKSLSGITDASGVFRIALPFEMSQVQSEMKFHIEAQGYMDLDKYIPLCSIASDLDVGSLFLYHSESYDLKVLDSMGKAISGARVEFFKGPENIFLIMKQSDSEGLIKITDHDLQRVVGSSSTYDIRIRATYPGKAPAFCCFIFEQTNTCYRPTEIILEPDNPFTGRIIDSETKSGIPNAEVSITPFDGWEFLLDPIQTNTKETGQFVMTRFSYSFGVRFRVEVQATDYFPYHVESGLFESGGYEFFIGFHEPLELDRRHHVKNIKLLSQYTGIPLSNTVVNIITGGKQACFATDTMGYFICPLHKDFLNSFTISVLGFQSFQIGNLDPKMLDDDVWIIKLTPLIPVNICVKDTLGNPVSGALTILHMGNGKGMQTSKTNQLGESTFFSHGAQGTEHFLRIRHLDYAPFVSKPFVPDSLNDDKLVFVLQDRATLLQKIRVVNEKNEPVPNTIVAAKLTFKEQADFWDDYKRWTTETTDGDGYCDMALPPFEEGWLSVWKYTHSGLIEYTDTRVQIMYEDVLKQKKVTILLNQTLQSMGTVQGMVYDEWGNPLKGVWIRFKPVGKETLDSHLSNGRSCNAMTRGDGSFRIKIMPGITYRASVGMQELRVSDDKKAWYKAEEVQFIKGGESLTFYLKSWSNWLSVTVNGCVDPSVHKYWLESEDGQHLKAEWTSSERAKYFFDGIPQSSIYFYGLPTKRMKLVFLIKNDRKFESSFFDVGVGKKYNIHLKVIE